MADTRWRFIDNEAALGSYNMALDMAMTLAASRGEAPATLRLYEWQNPTISLGYHQSETDIDLDRCRADGVDVVFRPTGGRAVLHHNEVTYSVTLPPDSPFFRADIMGVYELISRCLVRALRLLNVEVEFERSKKSAPGMAHDELSALCYASSAQYEIVVNGRKLVGSAQRRISNGALQHGSILVGDEHLNITHYLARDERGRRRVRDYMQRHTVSLQQVCAQPVVKQQLKALLKQAFAEELQIEFVDGVPSESECAEALKLQNKFAVLENS